MLYCGVVLFTQQHRFLYCTMRFLSSTIMMWYCIVDKTVQSLVQFAMVYNLSSIVSKTVLFCVCCSTVLCVLQYCFVYATVLFCVCHRTVLCILQYYSGYAKVLFCVCRSTIRCMLQYCLVYAAVLFSVWHSSTVLCMLQY